MKVFILEKIVEVIKKNRYIKNAFRVDENLIMLKMDKNSFFFDLTKGSSDIYIDIEYKLTKKFKAPFDIVLEKKFTKSKIIDVIQNKRILTIVCENQNRFKSEIVKIRFEFTGRYTNAIILDDNDIVIEALRHITLNHSSRIILPGVKLEELKDVEINEKEFDIQDVISYTKTLFEKKYQNRLNQKKEVILNRINKKIKEIKYRLKKLDNEEDLLKKSDEYKKYADILMANLYNIKPYDKEFKGIDFEGKEIKIPLPDIKNLNEIGNYYYKLSKKAKKKALNLHIEKEHLLSQLQFLNNYKNLVENVKDISELNIYKPSKKEKKEEDNIAKFYFDDYLILVGKNEKGNIKLLKDSNANDLWFHIKNYPGSHVIVKNQKLSINDEVIKKAAKLAVAFSNKDEGEVDYTKRKFVKVKDGANVEYGKYSTIKVKN